MTDISMINGDSKSLVVSCARDGTAVPLVNGDTVYFTVKKSVDATEKVLQKTITAFTDGKATINILTSDKTAFGTLRSAVNYVYDIQINFANGTVKTVVGPSKFSVSPGVTDE